MEVSVKIRQEIDQTELLPDQRAIYSGCGVKSSVLSFKLTTERKSESLTLI